MKESTSLASCQTGEMRLGGEYVGGASVQYWGVVMWGGG